ncbi:MAG: FecCD family ABC transporter permease [Candidatus Helarchaeota archaeon]
MDKSEKNSSQKIEKKYFKRQFLVKILALTFIIALILSFFFLLSVGDPYIVPFDIIFFLFKYKLGFPTEVNLLGLIAYYSYDLYRFFELWGALVFDIRMPRILLAFIVGLCLAISGIVMQGIFRNPLADPYILGISSGGGLGATVAIYFNFAIICKVWTLANMMTFHTIDVGYALSVSDFSYKIAISLLSFIFSCFITFLIYVLARSRGKISMETLLLSGIALSYIFSSITQLILISSKEEIHQMYFWGIGGLSGAEWTDVIIAAPIIIITSAILLLYGRDINVMVFGDDVAKSMGTNVQKTRRNLIILVSIETAVAVAFTGPIGFVGLICPHIIRLFIGNNHRSLMPLSALFGGLFLMWMDFIAQTSFYTVDPSLIYITSYIRSSFASNVPIEVLDIIVPQATMMGDLPVGIITSLIGGPFFIILLLIKRKKMFLGS